MPLATGLRYLKNLSDGSVAMWSKTPEGQPFNVDYGSRLAANGNSIVFVTDRQLVGEDADTGSDVYVLDLVWGSSSSSRAPSPRVATTRAFFVPSISGDGSKVAFLADAGDGHTTSDIDVVLVDVFSGAASLVETPDDSAGTMNPSLAELSADGSHLAILLTRPGIGTRLWVVELVTGDADLASTSDYGTEATQVDRLSITATATSCW